MIKQYNNIATGRRYNELGNLENWWSEDSLAEFNARTKCFVEQYSNYSVEAGPVSILVFVIASTLIIIVFFS